MPRILFVAEAVTLAHVGRPLVLAQAASAEGCEVIFACDARYDRFLEDSTYQRMPLHSISSRQFLSALARGGPVYRQDDLRRYVREDLRLIETTRPDLVVGDFRLSLSVSARLAGVRYAAITNAYWSPYCVDRRLPMPVLPLSRWLPLTVAQRLFDTFSPRVISQHCEPLNRLRQEHGLPSLGDDLRMVYTDSDFTLYADVPEMFATDGMPTNHHFIGPLLWSPPVPRPIWWDRLPADRPIVYVTLGSSGQARLLHKVLDALAEIQVTVIASTAGAPIPRRSSSLWRIADYLPGLEAAERADLVVCNGGSPTSQQALAAGVPVLGIASNMDQFLNMRAVSASHAGILVRADRCPPSRLRQAAARLLGSVSARNNAKIMATTFAKYAAGRSFRQLLTELRPQP